MHITCTQTHDTHTETHVCNHLQSRTYNGWMCVCVCVCVYLGVYVCVFVTAMPRTQNSTEDTLKFYLICANKYSWSQESCYTEFLLYYMDICTLITTRWRNVILMVGNIYLNVHGWMWLQIHTHILVQTFCGLFISSTLTVNRGQVSGFFPWTVCVCVCVCVCVYVCAYV